MKGFVDILAVTVIFTSISSQVKSDASKHRYQKGDPVPLHANKIGPYGNPSETYPYYSLPFCQPDPVKQKMQSIGEVLNGDRLASSPYKLNFLMEHKLQFVCGKNLTRQEVSLFQTAIDQDYRWEIYYDDLPLWGFIGYVDRWGKEKPEEYQYFIFTHTDFKILYSGDHVIGILASMSCAADLTSKKEVDLNFTYGITWQESNITFEKRMDEYIDTSIYLPQTIIIHKLAVANSLWTVLILFGCLVVLYVRVLRKDIYEYACDQESARDQELIGWKILHADVFRYPKYKSLFAAAIGSGTQLLMLSTLILVLGLVGVFHPYDRGVYKTALIISYAITCGVAGFTAVSFYRQLEGTYWMRNVFLTGCLFCGPLFLSFCFLNAVATKYGLTVAFPFGGIVIFLLWMLLALPLLLLGAYFGKVTNWEFQAPCHTSNSPREIPALRWHRGAIPQMALAGFVPFGFIFIELHDIFDGVWGFRVYNLYGILCIIIVLVIIATALVSVGLTYFQLAAEDHKWWWRSFLCGGSTGLYVFGYCFYYYFEWSQMRGFIQTSFFFVYMACICNGIFLMLGTVGFLASLLFTRYIYGSVKCD